MSAGVVSVRVLASIALAGLIGGSIWAQQQEGLWQGLVAIAKQPWGAVTLQDLGTGLVLTGLWIATVERVRWSIPLWWILLAVFGNIGTCTWLIWRTRKATTVRDVIGATG